jgi:hypothetical protein
MNNIVAGKMYIVHKLEGIYAVDVISYLDGVIEHGLTPDDPFDFEVNELGQIAIYNPAVDLAEAEDVWAAIEGGATNG